MRREMKLAAAAAVGLLAMASHSQASLLAYEPFNGTAGTTLSSLPSSEGSGLFVGQSWVQDAGSSAYATLTSGSLSSPYVDSTSGNAVSINAGNSASGYTWYQRTFSSAAPVSDSNHGTIFIGALEQLNSTVGGGVVEVLYPGSGTNTIVNFGYNGSKVSGYYGMVEGTGSGGSAGFTDGSNPAPASANTTAFLVLELNYNGATADTAELFVNPTAATISSNDYNVEFTGLTLQQVNGIQIIADNSSSQSSTNGPTEQAIFDEISVGTTFADVVGAPEPASLGVLGVGGAMLLVRRRRHPAR